MIISEHDSDARLFSYPDENMLRSCAAAAAAAACM